MASLSGGAKFFLYFFYEDVPFWHFPWLQEGGPTRIALLSCIVSETERLCPWEKPPGIQELYVCCGNQSLSFKAQFDAFTAMVDGLKDVVILVGHQRNSECIRRDKKLLGVEFIQL